MVTTFPMNRDWLVFPPVLSSGGENYCLFQSAEDCSFGGFEDREE
jgi:hypothetical protein